MSIIMAGMILTSCGIRNPNFEVDRATEDSGLANATTNSLQDCTKIHNELPIFTHYDNSIADVSFGGTDESPLPKTFRPSLDNYWASNFDDKKISDERANEYTRKLCLAFGMKVSFVHASESGPRFPRDIGVNIVQGAMIEGSIMHIVLPNNWNSNPTRKYPILAFSHYSANDSLFSKHGEAVVEAIIKSSSIGGAIGIVWNGGGSFNLTQNPKAQRQFSDLILYLEKFYKADSQNIAIFGGSRGGGAALTLASNPKNYPYRIKFAYAAVPPTDFDASLDEIGSAFPGLLSFTSTFLNEPTSWHPDWISSISGRTLKQEWKNVFLDPDQNGPRSIIRGLVSQKTQVFLELHTHDQIVPYHLQYEYYRALKELGGQVEASIIVLAGHGAGDNYFPARGRMTNVVRKLIMEDALEPLIVPGVSYKILDHATGEVLELERSDRSHPFTLTVPRVAYTNFNNRVIAVGEQGTEVIIRLVGQSGATMQTMTGKIGMLGHAGFDLDDQVAGEYSYSVRIGKPGETQKTINPFFTPGSEIQKIKTEFMALPGEEETAAIAENGISGLIPMTAGEITVGWGLSEYSTKKTDVSDR